MLKETLSLPNGSDRQCYQIERQCYAISVPQKSSSDSFRVPITQGEAPLLSRTLLVVPLFSPLIQKTIYNFGKFIKSILYIFYIIALNIQVLTGIHILTWSVYSRMPARRFLSRSLKQSTLVYYWPASKRDVINLQYRENDTLSF